MKQSLYDPRLAARPRTYAAADGDWHIDAALSEISIQFAVDPSQYLGTTVMPIVPVAKQSDRFFIWDKSYWFNIPDTLRARKTRANRVETAVSSLSYYTDNYALEESIAYEDLSNADEALALEESTARHIMQLMMADQEARIATLYTTAANVGSGVTLSGANQWSDPANSNPISDVMSGKSWIHLTTGQRPSTVVVGQQVNDALLLHPDFIDRLKHVARGTEAEIQNAIADIFGVGRYLIGGAVRENAAEGLPTSASSMTFIWGKRAVIFHVPSAPGRNIPSASYAFRWRPAGFTDFVVETKDDDDIKARLKRVNYFQDEVITASQLIYLVTDAVA